MTDLPLAGLIVTCELLLWIVLSAEMVAEHTGTPIPPIVRQPVRRGRGNLLIEIPLALWLLGIGQAVIVLMALHPASTIPIRLVAVAELAISALWAARL